MVELRPRSTLDGVALPEPARELPFLAQVAVRASVPAAVALGLPVAPNTATADALWLGPDEWLLVGAQGSERELAARALGGGADSVVEVSAQRAVVELGGPNAADVLAKGCSLDLERALAPGRCAQTLLARAQVNLHRPDELERYRIFVGASFATYLAAWLADAAAEYAGTAGPETELASRARGGEDGISHSRDDLSHAANGPRRGGARGTHARDERAGEEAAAGEAPHGDDGGLPGRP
jgi:sarcosine oxidase subunit gamma